MRTVLHSTWLLRRLSRRTPVWAALFALPLVMGLVRAAFPGWEAMAAVVWVGPLTCALLTASVFCLQRSLDAAIGLDQALAATPLGENAVLYSRVIAGCIVFALQVAILFTILALRF